MKIPEIHERQLLHAVLNPPTSEKVSRDTTVRRLRGRKALPVEVVHKSPEVVVEMAEHIRASERKFFERLARKHKSLGSLLQDKRITPTPETNIDLTEHMEREHIVITLSGLAPKSQNHLKSDHHLPDAAELAMLIHFEELARVAETRFGKRLTFKLLMETTYAQDLLGVSPHAVSQFREGVDRFTQFVSPDRVQLIDWLDVLKGVAGYTSTFERRRRAIQERVFTDEGIANGHRGMFPTVYMTIPPEHPHVYQLSPQIVRRGDIPQEIRRHTERSHEATINLMAFNRSRKEVGEREVLFGGAIYGSLTPGKDKLALRPLQPRRRLFGYERSLYTTHGVGIYDARTGRVHIRYVSETQSVTTSSQKRLKRLAA